MRRLQLRARPLLCPRLRVSAPAASRQQQRALLSRHMAGAGEAAAAGPGAAHPSASVASAGLDCRVRYAELLASGGLSADPAQQAAIDRMGELHELIKAEAATAAMPGRTDEGVAGGSDSSWWGPMFGGGSSASDELAAATAAAAAAGPKRALYVWGGVGCGKTMVMDLFYDCVKELPKRRVHFHSFMLEVHKRVHVETRRRSIVAQADKKVAKVAYDPKSAAGGVSAEQSKVRASCRCSSSAAHLAV